MEYLIHVLVLVEVYAILAISLDLAAGHTALVSIAHAAFFGVGAYTSALAVTIWGVPSAVGLCMGAVSAGAVSVVVSLPSIRLYEDYFVMSSFAFQMVIFSILNNWLKVTKGPLGLSNIQPARLFGLDLSTGQSFCIFGGGVLAISWLVARRIVNSPFGRVLRAIREDEVFARSLGKNTVRFKVVVYALSATLAGLAGSLYAHYARYIDPKSFTAMESIAILSMVVIGGAGSRWGPLLGSVVIVALPEALRFVGFPGPVASNLRQITYGLLVVVMMLMRPRGIMGQYGFQR